MTDATRLRPEPHWQPPWGEAEWTTQPIPVVQPEPPRPAGMRLVAALGVVLALYSYVVALWPVQHGFTPDLVLAIREWASFPLGIGEDFGLLGVGLLLTAGGSWACDQLGRERLALRVVALGYLPYLLACVISSLLLLGAAEPLTSPRQADPAALPLNLLLVDRLAEQDALIGLGWGVSVALFAAVLVALSAALLTRGRWLALVGLTVQLALIATLALTATGASGWYHELGQLLMWCVFPLLGQIVWFVRRHPGSGWAAAPLGVGCLAVLVAAERGYPAHADQWLPLTFTFAALVMLLSARAAAHGGRVDQARVVRWLSSRAYTATLLACVVGYPLLGGLYPAGVPFGLAAPLAIAITLALTEVVYRLTAAVAR